MNNTKWGLIRTFLTVAQTGSLSAASRELKISQPTVSRDIQNLEKSLKLNLFTRTPQGLILTEPGHSLIDSASKMQDAASLFERQVSGLSTELSGEVRISANEIVGIYLLPAAIAAFHQAHPGVDIEIVITNQASSINKREADIALRMFRPTQPDLVARRLPDMPLGFYAHQKYIDTYGLPESLEEFKEHTIIGYDTDTEFVDTAHAMGFDLHQKDFKIRTDKLPMQLNLARAGAGIIGTHVALAKKYPELVRVLEWIPLPELEFWVVCHSDTQYNSRIRALSNFLADWYKDNPYNMLVF